MATGKTIIPPFTSQEQAHFWSRVSVGAQVVCWPWTGCVLPKGYGVITFHQRSLYAHRVAYSLTFGVSLVDLCVLHTCDNPRCCNPDHLFLGTDADNVADMHGKGRTAVGGMLPQTRLTADDVRAIRVRFATCNVSGRALAREYGVAHETMRAITSGRTWKHIV